MSLERTILLKIRDNTYTVAYPTVGQQIRIQALKQELTSGQYANMSASLLKIQWEALEKVDIIAFFTVLIPKLILDSKVALTDLAPEDFEDLAKVYKDKFLSWYNAWEDKFKKVESGK
jgi:hypothetical protein